MEKVKLDHKIKVMYVTAESFPDGIQAAHEQLHSIVPFSENRKYLGISRPENGPIVYRAAAEELQSGEAEKYNCATLVLPKGIYACLTIHGYRKDVQKISQTFKQLLKEPNIDPNGYCVEWYYTHQDSMKCMVKLNQ